MMTDIASFVFGLVEGMVIITLVFLVIEMRFSRMHREALENMAHSQLSVYRRERP